MESLHFNYTEDEAIISEVLQQTGRSQVWGFEKVCRKHLF